MQCNTDIVSCITKRGSNVEAFSSSVHNTHYPSIAFNFSTDTYFHSDFDKPNQFWGIDFRQTVSINSYKITTHNSCNYMRNWTILLSHDNVTYFSVDSHSGVHPNGVLYQLGRYYKTRFLKIAGNAPGCGTFEPTYVNILAFNYVEFFDSSPQMMTYKTKYQRSYNFLSFVILIYY